MKILAVDTSATAASVAIADENKIIGAFSINTALTHSQTLIPMIDNLLDKTGLGTNDIDAIAVNAGPGSFTGVRIGVAAVKGLAFNRNLPCISVSTLHSMAFNMLGCECVVCAVMDARCSQVYNAMFRLSGDKVERLTEDRALALSDLKIELQKYNEKVVLVGDGAKICSDYLGKELDNVFLASVNNRIQNASSVVCAAFEMFTRGETMTASELMPTYLRLPQAQRELNKKLGVKS